MNDEVAAEKSKVRAGLRAVWSGMREDELSDFSIRICLLVLNLPEWVAAKSIMLYLPMPGEIDITALAKDALSTGRALTVPLVDIPARSMCPVRLKSWPVVQGRPNSRAGLAVPVPPADAGACPIDQLDLVIVPGRAFDSRGNRLGRGAGFYDRFLRDSRFGGRAIGIAPERVLLERVPTGAMDAPVEIIVTESRVIRPRPR